ncbi:bifunctional 4-hydroxy-2-oxoglutarate aldolase/2-dehydro-3-deoxy-phosphogluconate aldolase [Enterococcus songbeiensis]|uniref:bifunctional 4-hydroxy-2-oxoglutarate aldolase/2-dehydro-3-deoxy-phosphogluconate aldolase n=1 Tax=Enterococcus songbeiensis TaxID=2559927 RepID=UPI0014859BA8|nr:bifunctional 4-hydroxy-2-oxoglutarate aldolase/2-dehydro-3-deoxy-phosphogluconate aldolase [Enterococcus songbeiensis]
MAKIISNAENRYGVEIPLANDEAIGIIEKLKNNFPDLIIGAGTVINYEQLKSVHEKGVKFVLSPVKMTEKMLDYCKKNQIISVPGVFSPSEINEMKELNADIIKVFPVKVLGETFLKDVQAPLGELPLMAVGGVNSENASFFLKNGANYLGIGSGVFKKIDLEMQNYENLKKSLAIFEKNLKE